MKIGIDARFLTHPQHGGFKSYVENLIAGLMRVDDRNQYVLYVDRPVTDSTWTMKPNFSVQVVPGTHPLFGMIWREQIRLPNYIQRDHVDLMHYPCLSAPYRSPAPYVVSTFDTIWMHNLSRKNLLRWLREPKRLGMELYYRFVPAVAVRDARFILTDSCIAKKDVMRDLGVPDERVVVTYLSVGSVFRQLNAPQVLTEFRQKYHLPSQFVLGIGSADPRKNMFNLVSAYAKLPPEVRAQYHLVILWTHKFLMPEINKLIEQHQLSGQVHFLSHIPYEDLALLFNTATTFAFVSLQEGFGFPPVEAMACGTPVLAGDNSSMPEVVGDAAHIVNVLDSHSIAEGLKRILTDGTLRQSLSLKGLKRAAGFSWDKCARETVAVYERALAACSVLGIFNLVNYLSDVL